MYGLIDTAKANGLVPYDYLKYLFTELPKATTLIDIEALLPSNVRAAAPQSDAAQSARRQVAGSCWSAYKSTAELNW